MVLDKRSVPENVFRERLTAHDPTLALVGEYRGVSKQMQFSHACGHTWFAIGSDMTRRNAGCPACIPISHVRRRRTLEQYNARLEKLGSSMRAETYVNARTRVLHRCSCGYSTQQTPDRFTCNGARCLACSYPTRFERSRRSCTYRIAGRRVRLMGYEYHAVCYLCSHGVQPDRLRFGRNVPRVHYWHDGVRIHFPDMYLPDRNTLIEVKSTWTLMNGLNALRAKRNAALSAGYRYVVLVMDRKGHRVPLPRDWSQRSHAALTNWLQSHGAG